MGRLRLKFFYLLNELVGPADVNRECRKKSPRQVVAGFLLGRMCQSFEEDLKRSSRRFAAASFSSSSSDLRLVDFPNTASASARGSKASSFCACCLDRKSTRLNSSHVKISYAVFCLKKKN